MSEADTETLDFVPSPLHISEYKITKLPPGDEYSYSTFSAVNWSSKFAKTGGRAKKKTQEELVAEANEAFAKQEKKLLNKKAESELSIDFDDGEATIEVD